VFRRGTDPKNVLSPPLPLKAGVDSYAVYDCCRNRWGDFSATVLDPTDPSVLWTLQEYAEAGVTELCGSHCDRWGLWWGKVQAPAPKKLTLSVTRTGSGSVTSSPGGISCGADCSEPYPYLTRVALTQHPAAGFRFVKWTGACTGSGACAVRMTAAKSVGATFARK